MNKLQALMIGKKTNIIGLALIGYVLYQHLAAGVPWAEVDVELAGLGAGLLSLRAAIAKGK